MSKEGIGSFDPAQEDIEAYVFRLDHFLITKHLDRLPLPAPLAPNANAEAQAVHADAVANQAARESSRKSWMFRLLGPGNVQLLRDLCAPDSPNDKSFDVLCDLLKQHFRPARNKYRQREQFHGKKQAAGENVAQFAVALRHLSLHCAFGAFLDDALQTQFRSGLKSTIIREKLLDTYDNFQALVTAATDLEYKYHSSPAQPDVNYVFNKKVFPQRKSEDKSKEDRRSHQKKQPSNSKQQNQKSGSEGSSGKGPRCFNCNGNGHFSRVCPSPRKKKVNSVEEEEGPMKAPEPEPSQSVGYINSPPSEASSQSLDLFLVNAVQKVDRLSVEVLLDEVPIKMEVDTGAKASLIGRSMFLKYFKQPLKPTTPLCSCTGEPLPLLGEFSVNVKYKGCCATLQLVVVDGEFPSLMGLPWLLKIKLDWPSLLNTVNVKHSDAVRSVLPFVGTDELLLQWRKKYPAVFSTEPGVIKDFEVHIRLKEGAVPVFFSARSVPFPLMEPAKEELDAMEKKNYLRKAEPGPWGTPIVLVPKNSGQIRICGDYSVTVNPVVERNHFTLPTVEDLSLIDGTCFVSLDFTEAFQQLQLSPESRKILALSTPWGTYEPLTLQYGVAIAPEEFQAKVVEILSGTENTFIYLDNVLCWGKTVQECQLAVEEVLEKLNRYNVRLNLSKCEWFVSSVKFLGYVLDEHGLRPDPDKIKALKEAQVPHDFATLKSFLGFVNFYGKFAEHFSTILRPLYKLSSSATWRWGDLEQLAYDTAIEEISNKVLVPYSLKLPLRLTCDASQVGAGAVISHVCEDGSERPIAFGSKTFSQTELNYPQHEREAAALIFGVKKFWKFLWGREFQIVTDNRALVTIFGPSPKQRPATAARLLRWRLLLNAFRYSIVYAKGTSIPHADHLSRSPASDSTPVENPIYFVDYTDLQFVTAKDIADYTAKDPVLSRVYFYVLHGWPSEVSSELKPFHSLQFELSSQNGCLLRGSRVIIPPLLQKNVLELLHDMHPGVVKMKSLARGYVWWPELDKQIEAKVNSCEVCQSLHRNIPHEPYIPWTWASRRWQRVFVDFAKFEQTDILVILDHNSKWPEARIVRSLCSGDVIEVFRSVFGQFGFPEELVSDNGPPFNSDEFHVFCELNHITHTTSPARHPASNGSAEREVGILKKSLEKQLLDKRTQERSLQHKIDAWLFHYRNMPHSATKLTPSELFLGRKPRTHLSLIHPGQSLHKRMKSVADRTAQAIPARREGFKPGDLVWVRCLNRRKVFWLPGVLSSMVSLASCRVQVGQRLQHVSTSFLRARLPGAAPPDAADSTMEPVPPAVHEACPDPPVPSSPSGQSREPPETVPVPSSPPPDGAVERDPVVPATPGPPVLEGPFSPVAPSSCDPSLQPPKLSPAVNVAPSTPIQPNVVTRFGRKVVMPRKLQDDFVLNE